MSVIVRKLGVLAIAQRNGLMNHLLQAPARASGASRTATSAFSSHRSRSASMGRSWLKARASIVPLMPPAEAPAMISTTTRISRSEEHTSELQSLRQLVCRLLLETQNGVPHQPD